MEFPLIRTAESLGLPSAATGRGPGDGEPAEGRTPAAASDLKASDLGKELAGGEPPELRYEETIPRTLVHRASVTEVFLTDTAVVADDVFAVAAQLPRGHMIGERGEFYDFALIVEVLRQTGIVIAHRHLDVPLDMAFIFRYMTIRVVDLDALRIGPTPGQAVVTVRVQVERTRGGRVRALNFEAALDIDGRPALEVTGSLTFVTRGAFKAMRSRQRAARDLDRPITPLLAGATPDMVGRRQERNVVITEPVVLDDSRAAAKLVVDLAHPHLFDHPLDHVPGNLQIEAARQIATSAVARVGGPAPDTLDVIAMNAEFTGFIEHDLETRVEAQIRRFRNDDRLGVLAVPVSVQLTQQGETGARIELEVAQCR
ncbi:ScbA/BarX family gamma-butyrolactone biosynthesis protein [Actinomadura sp. 1N219]|uniref:ScbA/BarX family gamma-butyrolactone biosynthesis protein n=1 Tax=Actinomadura sp. 1N219 TaxID=3375152 RepID=UPI0037A97BE7